MISIRSGPPQSSRAPRYNASGRPRHSETRAPSRSSSGEPARNGGEVTLSAGSVYRDHQPRIPPPGLRTLLRAGHFDRLPSGGSRLSDAGALGAADRLGGTGIPACPRRPPPPNKKGRPTRAVPRTEATLFCSPPFNRRRVLTSLLSLCSPAGSWASPSPRSRRRMPLRGHCRP
ncbi:MAG: hypothetical protein BWY06_00359 [Candidatus Latescibacteria bacterium ADurb.Bin168]|nr:MAG: hypothetical protein BWY06_00359 [Candidatus Latescibacteria bacterium ADurb.Bin168]